MTAKRFFILKDEEFDDVLPCIRDRNSKIDDIYGHYKYDNLEEICNELNRLEKENEQLKEALFFYISVAITETSSHINEDLEKECNQLLKCSYKEALKKYDTSKYE